MTTDERQEGQQDAACADAPVVEPAEQVVVEQPAEASSETEGEQSVGEGDEPAEEPADEAVEQVVPEQPAEAEEEPPAEQEPSEEVGHTPEEPLAEPVEKTFVTPTTALPAGERPQLKEEPFEVSEINAMPTWALGVIFAAAISIVIAIAIAFLTPPTLALDRVVMDFDASQLEAMELTDSVYATNSGYHLVGEQPSGIEDNGTGQKIAYIDAAFENEYFSVIMGIEQSYSLVNREWVAGDYRVTRVDALPIAPVNADLALADIEKILSKVAPLRGSRVEQLYAGGEFEVIKNELDKDDDGNIICNTTISMRRVYDLTQYNGEVVATFQFFPGVVSSDAGTWQLVSAKVKPEAFEPSLATLEGAWVGTLESSDNTSLILSTGRCLAGRASSLTLEVLGYNQDSGLISFNVSFVSHNHEGIQEDADGTEGDVIVTLENQTVTLDPNTLEGSLVPLESGGEQGSFQIDFVNDDGSWEIQVTSGVAGSDGILSLGMTEFIDVYVLERFQADAP